jgi:acyl-ACP thioesterase
MFSNSVDGEILPIKRAQRFANLEEYDGAQSHTITYSDVDYNNHCNSCKYLEIMLDTERPTWLNEGIRLDITYVKELYFEEVMNTLWKYNEDEIVYQQKNKENTTCCNARISKIEKLSC